MPRALALVAALLVAACAEMQFQRPDAEAEFELSGRIAVRFKVQEIFVQTPGPAAGKRLMPREE